MFWISSYNQIFWFQIATAVNISAGKHKRDFLERHIFRELVIPVQSSQAGSFFGMLDFCVKHFSSVMVYEIMERETGALSWKNKIFLAMLKQMNKLDFPNHMCWAKCNLSHHLFKCIITQNIYVKRKEGEIKTPQQIFGAFSKAFMGEVGKL